MSKRQRRFRNYFIDPSSQFAFSARMVIGVVLLAQLQIVLLAGDAILQSLTLWRLGSFLVSAALITTYTVVVSHRVFGPVRAMENYLDKLIAEQPTERGLQLRPGDYLNGLATRLNKLGEKLRDRPPARPGPE